MRAGAEQPSGRSRQSARVLCELLESCVKSGDTALEVKCQETLDMRMLGVDGDQDL